MIERGFWGFVDFRRSYADKIAIANIDKMVAFGLLQAAIAREKKHEEEIS